MEVKKIVLIRLPGTVVREVFYFARDVVFSFFFISPRVLRGPSADRPETWSHGRKLSEFHNPSPKIQAPPKKKIWGPKTCKISVDFIQPPTLIVNISGTAQDI